MASDPVFDIAALLAPIDGPDPAGPADAKTASDLYFELKDARTGARDEAKKSWDAIALGREPPSPAAENEWWSKIVALAPRYLAEQSKNFSVAMWLLEAVVRSDGFAGLRDGLRLAAGLLETFGDGLYPRPNDEGPAVTVELLAGLAGTDQAGALVPPIREIAISDCFDPGPVTYRDYLASSDVARPDSARPGLGREDVHRSMRQSSPFFIGNLRDDLTAALAAVAALQAAVDARCGRSAPTTANIRRELQAILELLPDMAAEMPVQAEPAREADGAGTPQSARASAPPPAAEAITSREDAFRRLLKISEYFRATEPQSVIAQAIEDVVRRGRLTLPELVNELIPNEDQRRLFYLQAGIKPP